MQSAQAQAVAESCKMTAACCTAQAALSLLLCSTEVVSAGVLMARGQIGYLVGAMLATLAGMAAFCSAACSLNWGLQGVWWGAPLPAPTSCEAHSSVCCPPLLSSPPCNLSQQTCASCRAGGLLRAAVCSEHWSGAGDDHARASAGVRGSKEGVS
jgi:hypothetical protein